MDDGEADRVNMSLSWSKMQLYELCNDSLPTEVTIPFLKNTKKLEKGDRLYRLQPSQSEKTSRT